MKLDVKSPAGAKTGTVDVPDELFGITPNTAVMHQVVTAQLAAARAGTQSTKTRAEVRGGGAKPWRQKGTGRARQGSIRAPHWRGGGVAHGPKPRDYKQRTPKKMIRLALRSALSDRASDSKVVVVDDWGLEAPRTKDAIEMLGALGLRTAAGSVPERERKRDERVLIVLAPTEETAWKSFRNLGERVQLVTPNELNTYDVLVNDWLVFSKATLEECVARFGTEQPSGLEEATAEPSSERDHEEEQPSVPEGTAPEPSSERDQEAGAE
ncbi:MAG: 50S ribosomal protein L4 [Acidimicrobiia bacterium]